MKHLLLFPIILICLQLSAQPYNDCMTALMICNKQSITIDSLYGPGAEHNELSEATCFSNGQPGDFETNSCWIRFTAAQSGTLFFTITPENPNTDIDFVLFQLQDIGICQQKQLLRCMAAGETSPGDSGPCMGPTGLMPGETDTLTGAGCSPGVNNFLSPVYLLAGKTYTLCVQNFSDLNGFRMDFCGTALLGCETDTCTVISATPTHTPALPTYRLHNLYPNPVSASTFTLDLETEETEAISFTLINVLGQPVRKIERRIPEGRQTQEFPVDQLPAGAYWLQMTNGKSLITRQVWIGSSRD